jgi:predicted secreted protein
VKTQVGKVLIVKIRGNPTTGYGWYLENVGLLNNAQLEPLNLNEYHSSDDYITDEHEPGMVGVPGSYYFKFKAHVALADPIELKFSHKRPWEDQPLRTASVLVTIES